MQHVTTPGPSSPSARRLLPWQRWTVGVLLIPLAITALLASTSEVRAAAMLLATLGVGVILVRPAWGLLLFVALLYVRPEDISKELAGMRLSLTVSLVTLVGLAAHKIVNQEKLARAPLNGMIVGFGTAAVLSSLTHGNTVTAAMDVGKLVVLVLLVTNLIRTPAQSRALVTTILAFTAYLALYSIYLFQSGQALQQDGLQRSQAVGIFGDPNDLAATLVAGLALALFRLPTPGALSRAVHGVLAAVILYAMLLTNSRGGMTALIVVVGGFFLMRTRRRTLGLVLGTLAAVVFLAFGPSRMTRFENEESANGRFWFWNDGLVMLRSSPILGVGYNQFVEENGGMTAHNAFVLCFAELGLVGYYFWIGGLYCAFRPAARPVSPPPDATQPEMATGGGGGPPPHTDLPGVRLALTGYLMAAFWLSHTYMPVLYLLISLGAVVRYGTGPEGGPADAEPASLRELGLIALACVVSILIIRFFVQVYR